MTVRALADGDVELVQPLAQRSFDDLALRTGRPVEARSDEERAHQRALHRYHLRTGSVLGAYDEHGALVGAALSSVRGRLWQLALLVVEPGAQSAGAGSALLRDALATMPQGGVGTFTSSRDARALRAYARAGFRLLPALSATGQVDQARLGDRSGVRDGELSRDAERVGVAHLTQDVALVVAEGGAFLVAEGGCALVYRSGSRSMVRVLTAGTPREGQALLRAGLLVAGSEKVAISPLAPQQDWAVDVALAAGLELGLSGPVAVTGVADPLAGTCPPAAVMV